MNNSNIITIGTSLKWRGVYDEAKTYYQENIVASNGCVFRCKAIKSKGQPPIKTTDDEGYAELINTDIWDIISDITSYYNQVKRIEHYADDAMNAVDELNETLQTIDNFTKNPVEVASEDEMDKMIAAGEVLANQIYFVAESE